MPPIRSFSIPKPSKTERTHEENQERAYIAASRRSDRSLEARIESARRASEIHKRRTGRSLRVTEQDVVNEEMYEEEDDDLPIQYRRLTAHLNGNSSDFNRRLAAYLTNSVAMRTALDQAIQNTYSGQYPPSPWQPMAYNPWATADPQHVMAGGSTVYPNQQQPIQMMPPNTLQRSPHSQTFRQAPYPVPGAQNYRPNLQPQRSASISVPPSAVAQQPSKATEGENDAASQLDRRASMPVDTSKSAPAPMTSSSGAQSDQKSHSDTSLPTIASRPGQQSVKIGSPGGSSSANVTPSTMQPAYTYPLPTPGWSPASQDIDLGPLTTALPTGAQMFLNPQYDLLTTSGQGMTSDKQRVPTYSYNPNAMNKARNTQPMHTGMSQTLAPSALLGDSSAWPTPTSALEEDSPSMHPNYALDLDGYDGSKGMFPDLAGNNSARQMTPNEDAEWATFIDSSSWEETTT